MILSSRSVTLDGSGDGTIILDQVRPLRKWLVDRISISITGGTASLGGSARVFRGEAIEPNFIDGTTAPWSDVAIYGGNLELVPPDQVRIVFDACSPGQLASVTVQGEEVRLT